MQLKYVNMQDNYVIIRFLCLNVWWHIVFLSSSSKQMSKLNVIIILMCELPIFVKIQPFCLCKFVNTNTSTLHHTYKMQNNDVNMQDIMLTSDLCYYATHLF